MDWVDDSDGWMGRSKEGRMGEGEEGRKELGWEGKRELRREGEVKLVGKDTEGLTFFLPHPVSGSTITAEIQGVIDACVKLTGMPDLTLSFMVKSWAGDLVTGKLDASGKTERQERREPEGMVRAGRKAHGRPWIAPSNSRMCACVFVKAAPKLLS